MSAYDAIARLYDPWSASVVEDISFYVDEALAAGGPIVELGVGTGRIAIQVAMAHFTVSGQEFELERGLVERVCVTACPIRYASITSSSSVVASGP